MLNKGGTTNNSIRRDLSIGLSLAILLSGSLAGALQYYRASLDATTRFDAYKNEQIQSFAQNLAIHFWNFDNQAIELVCTALLGSEKILGVRVRDENNRMVFEGGVVGSSPTDSKNEVYYDGKPIGQFEIAFREDTFSAIGSNIALTAGLVILSIVLTFIPLMRVLLTRMLVKPLKELTQHVAELPMGVHESALPQNDSAELQGIATSFDDLSRRLLAREEEVERNSKVLEEKNAELERFAYTVSHDLKSPLITIKGFAGKLKSELGDGQTEHAVRRLDRIDEAAGQMGDLLESLLELSRIGRVVKPPVAMAFAELAHEVVELLSGLIAQAGAVVHIDIGALEVYGDRVRLREALQNLVENSLKFASGERQPQIEIGARTDEDRTVFYVQDNGIGIKPDYHERVFDIFDQLSSKSDGTGTGLALVKRIVESHGGEIWIESEGLEKGATFCFTLPSSALYERRQLDV